MPGRVFNEHAWEPRLVDNVDDYDSWLSPIVLRDLPEASTTLQQTVQLRHRQEYFVNDLRSPNPWIYI